jgi:predicted PurR-regulated permease PerM
MSASGPDNLPAESDEGAGLPRQAGPPESAAGLPAAPAWRVTPQAVAPPPSFFDWLPWEKILIWGLFLLAVYTLRHFFFIIFMTFLLAYIVRSVVRSISLTVSPRRERVWLERFLTVGCFALLLAGVYGLGSYLGPRLVREAEGLIKRVTEVNPQHELNKILTKTVGAFLFQRRYGAQSDPRYQAALIEFEATGLQATAYEKFPQIAQNILRLFESDEKAKLADQVRSRASDAEFEAWFLRERAPAIYKQDQEKRIQAWEHQYEESAAITGAPPLAERRKMGDFVRFRDERIHKTIFDEFTKDTAKREELRREWLDEKVKAAFETLKDSPEFERRFEAFYQGLARGDRPPEAPDYATFVRLREAHPLGAEAFAQVLWQGRTEEEQRAQARDQFETSKMEELAGAWMQSDTDLARSVRDALMQNVQAGLKAIPGWVQGAITYVITIPIQLALSLLLSFFITLDIPRMRRGLARLKRSRIQDFYQEIAPGLYNFGRLIGRAFQAQGVIALFNTLLTFLAITLLGIRNEIFLCGIVFICSFIPILGVVLSSIPIAIVAIVQPDGSIWLALKAIAAILVIHFVETSVLNPKILGDMLHLHPVVVLAVLAIGEHFFGIWGLLLAVPVTVYIIRCVILNEEIPGLIEQAPFDRLDGVPPRGPPAGPTDLVIGVDEKASRARERQLGVGAGH